MVALSWHQCGTKPPAMILILNSVAELQATAREEQRGPSQDRLALHYHQQCAPLLVTPLLDATANSPLILNLLPSNHEKY